MNATLAAAAFLPLGLSASAWAAAQGPSEISNLNFTSLPPHHELGPGLTWTMTTTMDIAIIAAVITAVALVLVCLLFIMLRYLYRHKGTYHTNEAKGTEFAESADAALQSDPALQDASDNSRKEYFI